MFQSIYPPSWSYRPPSHRERLDVSLAGAPKPSSLSTPIVAGHPLRPYTPGNENSRFPRGARLSLTVPRDRILCCRAY